MPAISAADGPVAVTGCSRLHRRTPGPRTRPSTAIASAPVSAMPASWRGRDAVAYLERLPNVEIVDGCDLFVPGSYDAAFAGCSAVFHTAAVLGNSADGKSQPLGSGDVAQDVYDGGMVGTHNVVDAVNASGSVRRLLYTSSMAAVRPREAQAPGRLRVDRDRLGLQRPGRVHAQPRSIRNGSSTPPRTRATAAGAPSR